MPWVGFKPTNPSVRAGEDSSCLRPRGHCDRLLYIYDPIFPATCRFRRAWWNERTFDFYRRSFMTVSFMVLTLLSVKQFVYAYTRVFETVIWSMSYNIHVLFQRKADLSYKRKGRRWQAIKERKKGDWGWRYQRNYSPTNFKRYFSLVNVLVHVYGEVMSVRQSTCVTSETASQI
jgi:hypothetical protein